MSLGDGDRQALKARLEWLRLMGVDAVRRRAGSAAPRGVVLTGMASEPAAPVDAPAPAHPPTPAHPPAPVGPQSLRGGLFGEAPGPEAAPGAAEAGPARRSRAAVADPGASPLVPFLAARARADADPAGALAALRDEIGDCRRCRLSEKRTTIVFGVGNPGARLMFVGEGPGADEDIQGEPFVGRAGHLLTKIIEAMGLKRADVYIANIVKCRPPENRTPLPDEVSTCGPFLFRQIAAIRPEVIVCLGTPATQTLLGSRETITKIRGIFRTIEGIRVMPTFHPAYLLRNPAAKREVWEDMKQVMAVLNPPV